MNHQGSLWRSDLDMALFERYQIDCARCCGLCCVALYFSQSEGFPENKAAGTPCKNLLADHRCAIHASLLSRGLKGCTAYHCFGAGQQVAAYLERPLQWGTLAASEADAIFAAYLAVLQLHHTLWYLTQAYFLRPADPIHGVISELLKEGRQLAEQPLGQLQALDPAPFRQRANELLRKASGLTASAAGAKPSAKRRLDYLGKSLRGQALQGRDLSMACLIAADLQGIDGYGVNFLGADLRDADLRGADLSQSLFLTHIQLNAAKGNLATRLPVFLQRPAAWQTTVI